MNAFQRAAALLLTLVLLAAPVRAEGRFQDVPEEHWAYASVQKAAEYGLVNGVGGGRFGAGLEVTRAQYAKMLCSLMGWELITPEQGSFADNQDTGAWYYSAIETACAHRVLVKEVLRDNCEPNRPLTREEMATMLIRALGYSASFAGIVQEDCPFPDVTTNRGYIALAYQMGFISGMGKGLFEPQTTAKREQAAAVLVRAYERLHAEPDDATALYSDSETIPAEAVWADPIADATGTIPLYPRAPLESVYAAAVKAGKGGVVALHTAPVAARARRGATGKEIDVAELERLLADEETRTDRSARYESSYLLNGERVVWYESEEDIAEKVQLCHMLGVSAVYLGK